MGHEWTVEALVKIRPASSRSSENLEWRLVYEGPFESEAKAHAKMAAADGSKCIRTTWRPSDD